MVKPMGESTARTPQRVQTPTSAQLNSHAVEYYSTVKKKEALTHVATRMKRGNITLHERGQTHTHKS